MNKTMIMKLIAFMALLTILLSGCIITTEETEGDTIYGTNWVCQLDSFASGAEVNTMKIKNRTAETITLLYDVTPLNSVISTTYESIAEPDWDLITTSVDISTAYSDSSYDLDIAGLGMGASAYALVWFKAENASGEKYVKFSVVFENGVNEWDVTIRPESYE